MCPPQSSGCALVKLSARTAAVGDQSRLLPRVMAGMRDSIGAGFCRFRAQTREGWAKGVLPSVRAPLSAGRRAGALVVIGVVVGAGGSRHDDRGGRSAPKRECRSPALGGAHRALNSPITSLMAAPAVEQDVILLDTPLPRSHSAQDGPRPHFRFGAEWRRFNKNKAQSPLKMKERLDNGHPLKLRNQRELASHQIRRCSMCCATVCFWSAPNSAVGWRNAGPAPCVGTARPRSCVTPIGTLGNASHDHRRARHGSAPAAAGLHRRASGAMRLLHEPQWS